MTDNERRRYYRITRFGSAVFNAESARLARMMTAVRRKAAPDSIRTKPAMEGVRP
jgi:hypothetical protein